MTTTYANVKSDFRRQYRMERLCRRAETGWGEDGPVVNVRYDGQMVRIGYAGNYWAMSPTAGLAASHVSTRRTDPLPAHFGCVLAAAKSRASAAEPGFLEDIFGAKSASTALSDARLLHPIQTKTDALSFGKFLVSANNLALQWRRVKLEQDATYCSSDIDREAVIAQIRAIDAEINRRYLSTPATMDI